MSRNHTRTAMRMSANPNPNIPKPKPTIDTPADILRATNNERYEWPL